MNKTQPLQPRKSPEPNRPFVNRQSELDLVQDKVNIGLRGDPIHLAVTCFWGPFGMGKSWLLRELEQRYKYSGLINAGDSPTLAARLDLNQKQSSYLWQDNEFRRDALVRELWKQLATQLNSEVPSLSEVSPEQWIDDFVAQVTSWSSDFIILIMMDTVDDLIRFNEESFFWLEQNLVERLILTGKVLLVFTSRGELRAWKRFQVRQRVETYKLSPFDLTNVAKEINTDLSQGQLIYKHSFGHPLVTDYLGTSLQEFYDSEGNLKSGQEDVDLPTVRSVLRAVVKEMYSPLEPQIVKIAKYSSVLRWISAELLRYLSEKLDPKQVVRGDVYYLDQIATLQSNHLLYWNGIQKNYEFDPVLRNLLTHFLEMDDSELFLFANRNALSFHLEHLENYPQYLARYIPELAYHHTLLEKCQSPEYFPINFSEWWQRFQETKLSNLSTTVWKELLERLENDDELRRLSPVYYNLLLSDTQTRMAAKAE